MRKAHLQSPPLSRLVGFLNRRWTARLIAAFFALLQLSGLIARGQTSEAPTPPPGHGHHPGGLPGGPPGTGPRFVVRQALREFDRFLDHHPLLEDDLRLNPSLAMNPTYLKRNPELNDFLNAHADTVTGLKLFPRYFLYRALIRQANAPLRYGEIAQIKDVLDQEPATERALVLKPELIRDPSFLQAHPTLRTFLTQHPPLGQVFASSSL